MAHPKPVVVSEFFRNQGRTVVITTELKDNGRSITNAPEKLIADVIQEFNLDPEKITWIEHYSPLAIDRIKFDWDGRNLTNIQWGPPVTQQEVEALIGQPFK